MHRYNIVLYSLVKSTKYISIYRYTKKGFAAGYDVSGYSFAVCVCDLDTWAVYTWPVRKCGLLGRPVSLSVFNGTHDTRRRALDDVIHRKGVSPIHPVMCTISAFACNKFCPHNCKIENSIYNFFFPRVKQNSQ